MVDFAVIGISGVLVVKYLVNALKLLGLPVKFALLTAIIIGIALSIAVQIATTSPQFSLWFEQVMLGLFVGLGASELFDFVKRSDIALDLKMEELWGAKEKE